MIDGVRSSEKGHGIAPPLSYFLGIAMAGTDDGHLIDTILCRHGSDTPLDS